MYANNRCENILQTRLYSVICGGGIFFLLLIWIVKYENDHYIMSETHFDLNRAVDKKSGLHFRVGFKYRNSHIIVSGIKAYPRKIRKNTKSEHLTKEEILIERTKHGQDLCPVLLINSEPDSLKAGADAWNKMGALRTVTGMNHDAYAIDLPGVGYTKIKGKLSSSIDFYKAILDHWHWPRVIIVAHGKSVDHILGLMKDDLKEFELRVMAVVLFITDAAIINHYSQLRYFKQTKLFLVYNEKDQSGPNKRLLEIAYNLGIEIYNEGNPLYKKPMLIPYALKPGISIFSHPDQVHEVLTQCLDEIYQEF